MTDPNMKLDTHNAQSFTFYSMINLFTSQMFSPCSGLIIGEIPVPVNTSKQKTEFDSQISEFIKSYDIYKKVQKLPSDYKAYELETNLHYVNIYFDVPPFYDRITKDRSAKFVDMLSAVGGTMGLLTGFSIISGIEVIYFAVKIMIDSMQRKRKIVK